MLTNIVLLNILSLFLVFLNLKLFLKALYIDVKYFEYCCILGSVLLYSLFVSVAIMTGMIIMQIVTYF